jgi:tRNA-specific 2-thiouridylase
MFNTIPIATAHMSDFHQSKLAGVAEGSRVVVAMSGGVDSSVVAALLKSSGYEVIGITLQLYDHGEAIAASSTCCAGRDIHDARRVAEKLDIPHYVLDYENRFESQVMEAFADSYLAGETPVPCVSCNQNIKFRDLLDMARDLGADALATGHYIASRPGTDGWELHRGADGERDQSYFLFATTPEQLAFLRFPLGDLKKAQTRELARSFGLQIADKSDSQDICFVPTGHYSSVIERLRPGAAEPGNIVDVDGQVLGEHEGIINYTIGQRRGIGVAAGEPLYVIHLDADRREVVVGPRENLRAHRIALRDVNWLGNRPLNSISVEGLELSARIRSTQEPQSATLYAEDGAVTVELHTGEDGVSPGQACVFYDGTRVLGGGWITATDRCDARNFDRGADRIAEVAAAG